MSLTWIDVFAAGACSAICAVAAIGIIGMGREAWRRAGWRRREKRMNQVPKGKRK